MRPHLLLIAILLLSRSAFGQAPFDDEARHGLLGRRYISGELAIQEPQQYHESFYDFDATARATLNIPIQWTEDNFATISQDVFFSIGEFNPFQNEEQIVHLLGDNLVLDYGNSGYVPDPMTGEGDYSGSLREIKTQRQLSDLIVREEHYYSSGKIQGRGVQIGTTIYGELRHDVRPFLQLGYWGSMWRLPVSASRTSDYFDHGLIINTGIEWDISERLTLRPQIDLNTQSVLKGSNVSAQLIWSPNKDWFISPGLVCRTDGSMPGGLLQIGCAF